MSSLLELANMLISGKIITKSEPGEDPDKISEDGAPTEDKIKDAREEAQAGQQAAGPEGGAPGEGEGADGSAEHEGGESAEDETAEGQEKGGDDDQDVTKAEVLKSMQFMADSYGLSGDEVVKAFSGLEGNPTSGKEPVGKGIEYLEGLINKQNDILGRIAGFLQELAGHTVKLGDQVTKSLEASEIAKSLAESTATIVEALPKTAPAKPSKGAGTEEVAKSLRDAEKPALNAGDLFAMALDPKCNLSPQDIARANRKVQGTFGG
jgi:hypothetical protein